MPERVNLELDKEIYKYNIDTTEAIFRIYEITETTRFEAKNITETYEDLQYVLQHTNSWEEARNIIQKATEQSKRLAIFEFIQTKNEERIARNFAIDALNLPPSIRHHVAKKGNHRTTNAFTDEFIDTLPSPLGTRSYCQETNSTSNTTTGVEGMDTTEETDDIREVSVDYSEEDDVLFLGDN